MEVLRIPRRNRMNNTSRINGKKTIKSEIRPIAMIAKMIRTKMKEPDYCVKNIFSIPFL